MGRVAAIPATASRSLATQLCRRAPYSFDEAERGVRALLEIYRNVADVRRCIEEFIACSNHAEAPTRRRATAVAPGSHLEAGEPGRMTRTP